MNVNRADGVFRPTVRVLNTVVLGTALCLFSAGCRSSQTRSASAGRVRLIASSQAVPQDVVFDSDPLPQPPQDAVVSVEPELADNGNSLTAPLLAPLSTPIPPIGESSAILTEVISAEPESSPVQRVEPEKIPVVETPAAPEPRTIDDAIPLLSNLVAKITRDYDGLVRGIDLAFQNVTDDHIKLLTLFDDVTEIDLTGTDISDTALQQIGKLTSLQSLKLKGTRISDKGIQHVAALDQLRILDLGRTSVSDSALPHLQNLSKLQYLLLNHTKVSDDGIDHLKSLTHLRGLNLINSKITPDGLSQLEKALPKCLVVSQTGNDVSFIHLPAEFSLAASGSRMNRGLTSDSDEQLQRLLELVHQDPELAEDLASVYSAKAEWRKAAAILTTASHARSDDANLQYRLAESLAYSGRTDEAFQLFRRNIGEAAANYTVGVIVYENALRVSESYLQRSVGLDPDNNQIRRRLEEVLGRRTSLQADATQSNPMCTVSLPQIIPKTRIQSAPRHTEAIPAGLYDAAPPSWLQP